jgi:hypothetical protein
VDKATRFWRWFAAYSTDAAQIKTGHEPIAGEIARQLSAIKIGLTWQIGISDDGPHEFIISADGDKQLFPAVKELVNAAPLIPGWTIIAFRPRVGPVPAIELNGREFAARDIHFKAKLDDRLVHLDIYMRGYDVSISSEFDMAAFIFLDSLLGEHDVETYIGAIALHPLREEFRYSTIDAIADTVDRLIGK